MDGDSILEGRGLNWVLGAWRSGCWRVASARCFCTKGAEIEGIRKT
jgi:hypothetical protein